MEQNVVLGRVMKRWGHWKEVGWIRWHMVGWSASCEEETWQRHDVDA